MPNRSSAIQGDQPANDMNPNASEASTIEIPTCRLEAGGPRRTKLRKSQILGRAQQARTHTINKRHACYIGTRTASR